MHPTFPRSSCGCSLMKGAKLFQERWKPTKSQKRTVMRTAARSARAAGLQATWILSRSTASQSVFSNVKARCVSIWSVWYAPGRTCSDSVRFLPRSRSSCPEQADHLKQPLMSYPTACNHRQPLAASSAGWVTFVSHCIADFCYQLPSSAAHHSRYSHDDCRPQNFGRYMPSPRRRPA